MVFLENFLNTAWKVSSVFQHPLLLWCRPWALFVCLIAFFVFDRDFSEDFVLW